MKSSKAELRRTIRRLRKAVGESNIHRLDRLKIEAIVRDYGKMLECIEDHVKPATAFLEDAVRFTEALNEGEDQSSV